MNLEVIIANDSGNTQISGLPHTGFGDANEFVRRK